MRNLGPGAPTSWSLGGLGQALEPPVRLQVGYTEQAIPGKHDPVCLHYLPSSLQTPQMRDKIMQGSLVQTQAALLVAVVPQRSRICIHTCTHTWARVDTYRSVL